MKRLCWQLLFIQKGAETMATIGSPGTPDYMGSRAAEREFNLEMFMGGSAIEGVAGATAAVLAILGIAGIAVDYMFPIATIAIGVALVVFGAAAAARLGHASGAAASSAEFIGGSAGVVLGVLALVGIAPVTLSAAAILIFGAAVLLGGTRTMISVEDRVSGVGRQAVCSTTGAQALVGLAAIVLGILALVDLAPTTLVLVALLSLGGSILLSSAALTGHLASIWRR
jgi:hypothetical protein